MSPELTMVADSLKTAVSYLDVFGRCDGDGKNQESHVKRIYRKLARTVHPDLYAEGDERKLAEAAFIQLQSFQDAALKAVVAGNYGHLPTLTIKTKRYTHELNAVFTKGDIADLYLAETTGKIDAPSVVKLARSPADTDLMEAEAKALKQLLGGDGDDKFFPFFPELIDNFAYTGRGITRRGNVLERLDGWYSLAAVRAAYPAGIHPLDMVWMWRKALWAVGYAHERGLIHGALTPDHIMIHPDMHGVKLVDWCYSCTIPDGGTPAAITAIAPAYRGWYPSEVLAKEPPSPGTDIYMLVKNAVYLTGGDPLNMNLPARVPKGIRAFFKGCTQANQRRRPQSAWQLLAEFDEMLELIGKPYFPRRFREFHMPV